MKDDYECYIIELLLCKNLKPSEIKQIYVPLPLPRVYIYGKNYNPLRVLHGLTRYG